MTHSSPFYVRIEKPKQALAATMGDMRAWLDTHTIQPANFKIMPTESGVAFDVRFQEEHHASLFQQKFAAAQPTSSAPDRNSRVLQSTEPYR
jgi:outer membrane lipoprotein-sorting protein